MRKKLCFFLIFSFVLLSCHTDYSRTAIILEPQITSTKIQEITATSTPIKATQALDTSSPLISTQIIPELKSISTATYILKTITPSFINADINYIPELFGNLYVGSSDIGQYVSIDFDKKTASRMHLPRDCYLLSNGQKAVCEVREFSDIKEIYVLDVLTGHRDFSDKRDVGRWELTSSERFLKYMRSDPGGGILLEMYDFTSLESYTVGKFDDKETMLSFPWISNSGQIMIGVNFEDKGMEFDDRWYRMNIKDMKEEPIHIPANIVATDSVEWSPDDALAALVGFYRDDKDPTVGTLRCTKVVLFYDPNSQVIKFSVQVPEGQCITPIALYQDSIWSPDSSKLALVLDQRDICVVDVTKYNPDCVLMNNPQSGNEILSLTWSPDSNNLAFFTTDGKIKVFSFF